MWPFSKHQALKGSEVNNTCERLLLPKYAFKWVKLNVIKMLIGGHEAIRMFDLRNVINVYGFVSLLFCDKDFVLREIISCKLFQFCCFLACNSMGLSKTCFSGNHLRCSIKMGVFKNFAKFTRKRMCLLIKYMLRVPNFIIKIFHHRRFPVNFAKF